jgi:arylsulfatase A-like enzyme
MTSQDGWGLGHALRRATGMGVVLGVLVALAELSWTYRLPEIFPARLYVLPESIVELLGFALALDVPLALLGCLGLGLFTWAVVQRLPVVGRWPDALFDASALFMGTAYLVVGLPFTYYVMSVRGMGLARWLLVLAGLGIACLLVGALLSALRSRFGARGPAAAAGLAALALVAAIVPAYAAHAPEPAARSAGAAPAAADLPPVVVLVTLDTVSAHHLEIYGNEVVKTPSLAALAADGIVYEQAISQAPLTSPSHASIMTSTYPTNHGAMNGSAMTATFPTLAERLRDAGYATGGFVSANILRSTNSGLHRGFDYYEDSISPVTPTLRHDALQYVLAVYLVAWAQDNQIPGRIVTDRSLDWLHQQGGRAFVWLHYYDAHEPFGDVPEPYRSRYRGAIDTTLPQDAALELHAGEVAYVDFEVGRVLDDLRERGLYDDALIVVTADHGEGFGEQHGENYAKGHGDRVWDTTQHVPLVVKLPGNRHAGTRVDRVVQTVDIAPSILEVLGVTPPTSFRGASLLAPFAGDERDHVAYSEAVGKTLDLPGVGVASVPQRRFVAMRNGERKYIFDLREGEAEVYDLEADPDETTRPRARADR